jgi:hypothetical protein
VERERSFSAKTGVFLERIFVRKKLFGFCNIYFSRWNTVWLVCGTESGSCWFPDLAVCT